MAALGADLEQPVPIDGAARGQTDEVGDHKTARSAGRSKYPTTPPAWFDRKTSPPSLPGAFHRHSLRR
jgi:hypothetical protein